MAQKTNTPLRFAFGKNWAEYVDRAFSEERVKISQQNMLHFLNLPNLKGKTFLDIGCGSGIHSLAAWQAGADQVISFDYDADSVATTRGLWRYAGEPDNWQILQGSVLDRTFLQHLPKADIVYSWGVLHHTGAMWDAVAGAASAMKENGVFFIALYCSDIYVDPPPNYWLKIKKKYNHAGRFKRRWMEWSYCWRYTIRPALRSFQNPFKQIWQYKESRGMSYWTDVRDWLGGWPMEFAGIGETKEFCERQLGLELLHIRAGEGNTQYLFRKKGAVNYWDAVAASRKTHPLRPPFIHVAGHCFRVELAKEQAIVSPHLSQLMLYEDGVPVGFPHQSQELIERFGTGRYSHQGPCLFFSATDNTSPNQNGRHYAICLNGL